MNRFLKAHARDTLTRDVRIHFYIALTVLLVVFIAIFVSAFQLGTAESNRVDIVAAAGPATATFDPESYAFADTYRAAFSNKSDAQKWRSLWIAIAVCIAAGAALTVVFHTVVDRLERRIRGEQQDLVASLERQRRNFEAVLEDRKNELKVLAESEKRFRAMVEGSSHGIIVHRDGCPVYANTAIAEMLGYSDAEDILALSSITDFVYVDDVVLIRNQWTRRMQGEEMPEVLGYRWQRKDDTVISVEVRATTIDWDGEPVVLGACYDTTEQKNGEYAVRQNEVRLRRLLETIPYGVQENDIEGTITFSNSAHAAMLGYDQGDLIGKKVWDLEATDKRRRKMRKAVELLVEKQPPPTPYFSEYLTKDGRKIDVRIDWTYIRSQTGHLLGFSSILTDVTDSKRTQQSLERSEEHFRTLSEASVQGITVIQDDRFMFANRAAAKMLGYDDPETLLSLSSVDQIVHAEDRETVRNRRFARLRGEHVPSEYEFRTIARNGGTVWVENRVTTIEWDGKPAIFSIYTDITPRKVAKRSHELADQTA